MATVLVVDGNLPARDYVVQLVDILGHRALPADGGAQALELMEEQVPDLLITEIELPRMDGLGLVEELRSRPALSRIPVLFYGRHPDAQLERNARSLGVMAVLKKPGHPKEWVAAIRAALKG